MFDEERLGLQHQDGTYFIDLLRLDTQAKVLDILAHLCQPDKAKHYGKTVAGDLLHAINEVFYLQEYVCSYGVAKEYDTQELLDGYVKAFHQQHPLSKLHRNRWRPRYKTGVLFDCYTIPFENHSRLAQPA